MTPKQYTHAMTGVTLTTLCIIIAIISIPSIPTVISVPVTFGLFVIYFVVTHILLSKLFDSITNKVKQNPTFVSLLKLKVTFASQDMLRLPPLLLATTLLVGLAQVLVAKDSTVGLWLIYFSMQAGVVFLFLSLSYDRKHKACRRELHKYLIPKMANELKRDVAEKETQYISVLSKNEKFHENIYIEDLSNPTHQFKYHVIRNEESLRQFDIREHNLTQIFAPSIRNFLFSKNMKSTSDIEIKQNDYTKTSAFLVYNPDNQQDEVCVFHDYLKENLTNHETFTLLREADVITITDTRTGYINCDLFSENNVCLPVTEYVFRFKQISDN